MPTASNVRAEWFWPAVPDHIWDSIRAKNSRSRPPANLKCLPHGGQSAASRIPADELIFQTEHLASPQNRGSVAEVRYVRSTPSGNVR
jgi:hypothetical protein